MYTNQCINANSARQIRCVWELMSAIFPVLLTIGSHEIMKKFDNLIADTSPIIYVNC